MCLNIGTPKTINFPFETNKKLMALGVPIYTQVSWTDARRPVQRLWIRFAEVWGGGRRGGEGGRRGGGEHNHNKCPNT